MHETEGILSMYPFFQNAPDLLRNGLLENASPATLGSGEHFFETGQCCSHIALVGGGSVRVYTRGESGREITLYHVRPGETCPINLVSGLLNIEVPASAIVEDDLNGAVLPVAVFRSWLDADESIRRYVLEALAVRFANVVSLVGEITTRRVDRRLAQFLLNRFETSGAQPRAVEMTHERIAGELGTAREVVSRLLSEFERNGAVTLGRGRIQLREESVLRGQFEGAL